MRKDGRVHNRAHRCHQENRRPGSAEAAAGADESESGLAPEPALAPDVLPGPDTAGALAPRSAALLESAPPVHAKNTLIDREHMRFARLRFLVGEAPETLDYIFNQIYRLYFFSLKRQVWQH